jgi:hypothetical protein
MYNNISNFIFGDTSAPLSNRLARFIISGKNGTTWVPARKSQIYQHVSGL